MSSSGGASTSKTIWELSPAELEVLKSDVKGYLDGLRVTHCTFYPTFRNIQGAVTSLLVWDIIITWDREVHYVWKSRWSYAKLIFLFNRYLGPLTFLPVLDPSQPSGTIVSSVLAARLWAVYERDRRVLAALIIGYFVCFAPGWILAFTIGGKYIDQTQLRVMGNVMTYIGGVSMQSGSDVLDWRFKKCYRFPFSKISWSIIVGALLYESGIFVALVCRMYKDQRLTRIIEAFYRDGITYYLIILSNYAVTLGAGYGWNTPVGQGFAGAAFYIGIKSMTCSHIILRLRSYFSFGDPVVDGHVETDPFDKEGKMVGETTSSSFVSTIILFAQMISGTTGGATFEIKSKHLSRIDEHRTMDVEEMGGRMDGAERRGESQFNLRVTSPTLPSSSPTSPRHSLDWTSNPKSWRPRLNDPPLPRRSDVVVGPEADPSSPSHSTRPGWLSRRLGGPEQVPGEGNRHSGSFGPSRYLSTLRPWEQPFSVEMDDLSGASQDVRPTRRSTEYPDPQEQPPEIPPLWPPGASETGAHHRHPRPRREGSGD
ncbi:hypothetical protein FS837_006418 [Tulasnella sp. UAMH 9824]|nr:hypothetical protein FS837_006418 [Tulasnella sp. UAMH 9824]